MILVLSSMLSLICFCSWDKTVLYKTSYSIKWFEHSRQPYSLYPPHTKLAETPFFLVPVADIFLPQSIHLAIPENILIKPLLEDLFLEILLFFTISNVVCDINGSWVFRTTYQSSSGFVMVILLLKESFRVFPWAVWPKYTIFFSILQIIEEVHSFRFV